MKNRTRVICLCIAVLAAILLLPIPRGSYDDGGTREYVSLTYRAIAWNKLYDNGTDGVGVYKKLRFYGPSDRDTKIDELWKRELASTKSNDGGEDKSTAQDGGDTLTSDTDGVFSANVYRCDDVYRTNDTPVLGHGVLNISLGDFILSDFQLLYCDDNCHFTSIANRAAQGYAAVHDMVSEGKLQGSHEGWKLSMQIPTHMEAELKARGEYDEIAQSLKREYYYLLSLDKDKYAYIHISPKQGSAQASNEAKTVDDIVRSATVSLELSTDSTIDDEKSDLIGKKLTVSAEQWEKLKEALGEYSAQAIFEVSDALVRGDYVCFSEKLGVPSEVYRSLEGMEVGECTLCLEQIPALDDESVTRPYAMLEFEVIKSESDYFTPGIHRIVFDEGLYLTFSKREDMGWYADYSNYTEVQSNAEIYVSMIWSDRDFYCITGENRTQFGLGDFIAQRLNVLGDNFDGAYTADEIKAYAQKYLGVDPDSLELEYSLDNVDGKYKVIGRGGMSYADKTLSVEVRDGLTVVTKQFYADYSKSVPSRKVEFYLELLDGEFKPIKSVILEDSEFKSAVFST